jgi:hypothetical protein
LAGLAAQDLCVGDKIAMQAGGQFDSDLHGLVVGNGREF